MKKSKKQPKERKSFKDHLRKIMTPEEFAKWQVVRNYRKHKKGGNDVSTD